MFTFYFCIITIILMIISLIILPKIKIGKVSLSPYYIITLFSAIILLMVNKATISDIKGLYFSESQMNPLKIIILFLSMTSMSIFLDQLGLFKYLAIKAAMKFEKNQISLFIALFVLISILTVFTSNDIIILTFTPFICYFCKHANINPIPYLIGEFFAANTLSMTLMIGNPTNIYIASKAGITFIDYFKEMFLVGIISMIILGILLILVFYKSLNKPLLKQEEEYKIENKILLVIGLIHLGITTICLAISNYIHIPMYLISFVFSISLLLISLIYCFIKHIKPIMLKNTLSHLPYAFIPFLLSMVVITHYFSLTDMVQNIAFNVSKLNSNVVYGIGSMIVGNLINNIPMSILFSDVFLSLGISIKSIYMVIASSNLCALITPVGSLAGMMFISLVKKYDIKLGFLGFVKYSFIGIIVCCFSFLLIMYY